MPFQSVPNTAKFDCIFAINGTKRAQFSLYVNNDVDPWDATQLTNKATDISNAIVASYLPVLSEVHDFLGVVARDLEAQFGRVEEVMLGAPSPGTLVSPTLPGNVAVCATLKSATGAPRRGRIFLMPPAESQVTGDLLTGAAQAALQEAVEDIHDAATSGAANSHVIISRYSGSELREGPRGQTLRYPVARNVPAIADVAVVQVKARTDSMRSRLSAEPA